MSNLPRLNRITTSALLLAAFLLLIAFLTEGNQEKFANSLFENKLWLPGHAISLTAGWERPAVDGSHATDGILLLEGEEGFQNTIKIPQTAAPAQPSETPVPDAQKSARTAKFNIAVKLMREGKLDDAEREWLEYVSTNPDDPEGWRQLGDCRYNLNKISEALGAYRVALRKDPGNYLAERGRGVASLFLGYDAWEKDKKTVAHEYFQGALGSLHTCLKERPDDALARYGQALAAEGVSRHLYVVACREINGDHAEQAKEIIRNCLDILDMAIRATEERVDNRPDDAEARMLLGCLLMRRAKILQPFGHVDEAVTNLKQAMRAFEPLTVAGSRRSDSAKSQIEICQTLVQQWAK